jgi:misacylated tRNA(Ala) deacylase
METKQLYLHDSYQIEFEAVAQNMNDNWVVLDQTCFHPLTGGVASDTGHLIENGLQHEVLRVEINRETREIAHFLKEKTAFKTSSAVEGMIDWDRRYRLMRLHTAAHLIAAVLFRDHGALITGGQVNVDQAKLDFSLEKTERTIFEETLAEANFERKKDIQLKTYFLDRNEALRMPGIVKLAERMPPQIRELRIVEIPGIDMQADGGPHVNNTREIGEITLVRVENRGKMQRRVYFAVE